MVTAEFAVNTSTTHIQEYCVQMSILHKIYLNLSRFQSIKFFDDHGLYSPWVEREIWPFLKVAISPKPKRSHPPKMVCTHLTCVYTCMNFLSRFRSIEFFDDHSPWVKREIWLFLKVAISLKPKKSHPPKLVCMYITCVYICMNFLSRFRSIEFFDDHGL